MKTEPASGVMRHPSKDSKVVFPLPEGPITSVNVDGANSSDTSVSARTRVFPDPNDTLAFSTASECSSTEDLGRLDGDRRLHREYGSESAHGKRGKKNTGRQPPRRRYPRNVRPGGLNQGVRDEHSQQIPR